MSAQPSELLRRYLPCDSSAPRLARQALAGLDAIKPVRNDALLVASELVTNAVLHSGCHPSEQLEVVAETLPGGLRIVVTDPGRSDRAPKLKPSFVGPGGNGLRVVDALARRWGTERREGLRVWAELSLARREPD
jgi:anti-sigma regulatory factor (Ser/Thr protein kinase)